jgi:hypothetical protein
MPILHFPGCGRNIIVISGMVIRTASLATAEMEIPEVDSEQESSGDPGLFC